MRPISAGLLLNIFLQLVFQGCQNPDKGEALAKKHCSSCHQFASPDMLDKKTWRDGVLPEMKFRMGLSTHGLWNISQQEMALVMSTIPDKPMVTEEEWWLIENYFVTRAPDSLFEKAEPEVTIPKILTMFSPSTLSMSWEMGSMISLLKFNPTDSALYVGTRQGSLLKLDNKMVVRDTLAVESAPSQLYFHSGSEPFLLTMGVMDPNDWRKGKLNRINIKNKKITTILDSLKRPVFMEETDLNNDGEKDLVIACFGNFTGELLAFEKTKKGYKRHVIQNFPGTRKVIIRDVNKDGYNDIISLATQGDERITLFVNRGEFKFYQRQLLRFPPAYGSSYFNMADINQDGLEDIIYSNGDNGDFSPILKPYHGIRIFYNDGDFNFKQEWFYPMHGASKVMAHDFDLDGDLDLAAISFFPDFSESPQTGFLYFENTGNDFTPYYTPFAASGRWIVMELGDLDFDGDQDILLGALNFSPGVPPSLLKKWQDSNISILKLENKVK